MKNNDKFSTLKLIFAGIIGGAINGFFGAGGGLILVPILEKVGKNESRVAHATALICVLCMSLTSSIMYIIRGQINYKLILNCLIGSLIGSFFGTKILKKLKNNVIDIVFACILIFAGISMIIF